MEKKHELIYTVKLSDFQLWGLSWAIKATLAGTKINMQKSKKRNPKQYDALCELSTSLISAEKQLKKLKEEVEDK